MIRARLLCAALLGACAATKPSGGSFSTDIFEDVPAPRTAIYRDAAHESFSYRTATHRCGRFRYDYTGSQSDAIEFFRQTMTAPPYSWAIESDEAPVDGSASLVFRKGDDRCTVDIDRHADGVRILVRVNYLR